MKENTNITHRSIIIATLAYISRRLIVLTRGVRNLYSVIIAPLLGQSMHGTAVEEISRRLQVMLLVSELSC